MLAAAIGVDLKWITIVRMMQRPAGGQGGGRRLATPAPTAGPVTQVVFKGGTASYSGGGDIITGSIAGLVPGQAYAVAMEVLRNDLGGGSEYVADVTLGGNNIGECNPDGSDYARRRFRGTPDLCTKALLRPGISFTAQLLRRSHDRTARSSSARSPRRRASWPPRRANSR